MSYNPKKQSQGKNLKSTNRDHADDDDMLLSEKQHALKEYLQDCFAFRYCCAKSKKCCLHKRGKDLVFERAREKFTEELDLVQMLRDMRFFKEAVKKLISEQEASELR